MVGRPYDEERDLAAVTRMWREVGWIDDTDEQVEGLRRFLRSGQALLADVDGEAECMVHRTPGTVRYLGTDLPLCAITGVTTSHVGRRQGLATALMAETLAIAARDGAAVAGLGFFEQGSAAGSLRWSAQDRAVAGAVLPVVPRTAAIALGGSPTRSVGCAVVTAQLLAGAPVAEAVLDDVRRRVERLSAEGKTVGLGTILVGDDEASAGYVRKKHETCATVGVQSHNIEIAADEDPQALLDAVDRFNADPAVDGYLIQYPVAAGFDFDAAVNRMDPDKDADGLHPQNLGRLVLQQDGPVPCTPAGIRAMFVHHGIDLRGKDVVIVGRGPTLGRPLSLLLTLKGAGANAAVTVVHSAVDDIAAHTRRADVVIAAVGSPSIVTADMVKPGAVVVSGGISWEGRKLLPDVDEGVAEVASWVTPRLGGVGPTTVAMLLRNTVAAAEAAHARGRT